jgi:anti-sigma factor RsiW
MSELVTDYLDGALPLRARLQARMHLFLCTACQQYFDQIRQTVRLLGGAPRAAPAADTERRLLSQVGGGLARKPGDPE